MISNPIKKAIVFCGIISFCGISLFAQEKKYTFNSDKSTLSLLIDQKKTRYTVAEMQARKRGAPMPESEFYTLGISADTIGGWSVNKKSMNWILDIDVPKAKGFFIGFDEFYLPQGAQLFVYNKKKENDEPIVYTHADNPQGGAYSIENLFGDNVTLEYVAPKNISESPHLVLSGLGYKYIDDNGDILSGFNSSTNSCMINTICPEAEQWQTQKKGVIQLRMLKRNGRTYLCSGSLINNTANDKTPYVLTADHCFEDMTREEINANTEFFFEYESETCEMAARPNYKYHKGSQVLVLNPIGGGSDGALLKLDETIPDDWDLYFNGWDRTDNAVRSGAIIHHPLGDVKKITFYNKPLTSGKWDPTLFVNTHWIATYSAGATEGGSSGSPIFNESGLVVGTLTGGDSGCNYPNDPDMYGKMWYHWDQYQDTREHMSQYLDPINTGAKKLAGIMNADTAVQKLVLDNTILDLVEKTAMQVNILSGNGGYTVSSSDDRVAPATIEGNTIYINAQDLGAAVITVTDKKKKSVNINIKVHQNIDISIGKDKMLAISAYSNDNAGDMIKEVMIVDLDANTLYHKKNLNEQIYNIDLSIYPRSIYIIKVKTHKGTSKAEKITW